MHPQPGTSVHLCATGLPHAQRHSPAVRTCYRAERVRLGPARSVSGTDARYCGSAMRAGVPCGTCIYPLSLARYSTKLARYPFSLHAISSVFPSAGGRDRGSQRRMQAGPVRTRLWLAHLELSGVVWTDTVRVGWDSWCWPPFAHHRGVGQELRPTPSRISRSTPYRIPQRHLPSGSIPSCRAHSPRCAFRPDSSPRPRRAFPRHSSIRTCGSDGACHSSSDNDNGHDVHSRNLNADGAHGVPGDSLFSYHTCDGLLSPVYEGCVYLYVANI